MKRPTNKAIRYLLKIIVFLSIPIFFYSNFRYHLIETEEYQMFLLSWAHFFESLTLPGGLMDFLGTYLNSYYYLDWGGPLILGSFICLTSIMFERLMYRVTNNKIFFILPLIVAIMLATLHLNMLVSISATIMFLFTLFLGWVYTGIKQEKIRYAAGFVFILLAYWLAAISSIILFTIILVWEFLKNKSIKKYGYLGLLVTVLLVLPLLARYLLINNHPMTIVDAYTSTFFSVEISFYPNRFYPLWLSPSILLLLVSFINKKMEQNTNKRNSLILIGQLLLLVFFLVKGYHKYNTYVQDEEFMKIDTFVKRQQFKGLVQLTKEGLPLSPTVYPYVNLALVKTGRISHDLLYYPNNSISNMLIPYMKDYLTAKMLSEIFYQIGDITNAQHMAFEAMVSTPGGANVYMMKRLAECALILQEYPRARIYLLKIAQTPRYGNWAKTLLQQLKNKSQLKKLSWIKEKRSYLPKTNTIMNAEHIGAVCIPLVQANPNNKSAFDYLAASFLLTRDIKNFMNLYISKQAKVNQISILHQQGLASFMDANRIPMNKWGNVPISPKVRNQFIAFKKAMMKYQTIPEALHSPLFKKQYKYTYWYYYLNRKKN